MRKHVTALILILIGTLTVTTVFTPKGVARVVIHEFPGDRDYAVIVLEKFNKK